MKRTVEYSITCIVGIIVYLFWAIPYRGILNYHEEFQLFQTDSAYFLSHLMQRGGFAVYISEFLVQFYNNYWIGAMIIALEFILIQRMTLYSLKQIHQIWGNRHGYMLYCMSFIPMLLLWIVLGDVNVMHSLIVAVGIALLLICILFRIFKNTKYRLFGFIIAISLYIWTAGISHYRIPTMVLDISNIYNAKTIELLDYDLLVRTNRWADVIRKAEKKQPDLPLSVCATNLALGMTNQIANRAGEFFQNGPEGLFPSFGKDPFSTLTTAEVYFHLGLINTAQRYYFEAMEAAPNYKKSCRCIRRLAETNLINGQYNVARKYLHILEKTLFYKNWAKRTLAMIDKGEEAIMSHPLYSRLRRMKLEEDFLYSDREIDKICGRLVMHNHENVLAMQYMLFYPILENNYEKFVQYVSLLRENVPYSQELASFERYIRK